MMNRKPLPKSRPWGIDNPVDVVYEPGPLLFPSLFRLLKVNPIILKVLARYPVTGHPIFVVQRYVVSERIVEMPFVLRNLDKEEFVLDIGSSGSVIPLELAHLGYKVWAVDQRTYPLTHPNLVFVRTDACATGLPPIFFDAAISLSTIEHIGIGFYGDPERERGDDAAMRELCRVLKPSGKLILTVPFGRPCETWQRVYDSGGLARLLANFHVEKSQFYRKHKETWIATVEAELSDVDSSVVTNGVALIVARKA